MTFIPDNSSNNNDLILNGNSVLTEGVQEKKVEFKNKITPTGLKTSEYLDHFGENIDFHGDTLVVGVGTHRYNITGTNNPYNMYGAVWVFERSLKPISYKKTTKVKHRQVYTYTGDIQTFTVPENVDRITIQLIGAGGGGNTTGTFSGGNGAYVKASVMVRPGHTYGLIVGQGGVAGGTTSAYGGGGYLTESGGIGGSGGGRSALVDLDFGDMITAGAGGGAGKDGPGGHGGIRGGNGTTILRPEHSSTPLNALGAFKHLIGRNEGEHNPLRRVLGSTFSHTNNVYLNNDYLSTRYNGGNASPASTIAGNIFENGAGGGGFAGGAAGPDGYSTRETTAGAWTDYSVGGSGAGGSSMVEPSMAFAPFISNDNVITNVKSFNGDELALSDELSEYGIGGTSSTPGTNGVAIVEWIENDILEDENVTDRWIWKQTKLNDPSRIGRKFGAAVAVYGDWIAAGIPADSRDINGVYDVTGTGTVAIFNRIDGTWTKTQYLQGNRNANEAFGSKVAFAGGKLFVGAPGNNTDSAGTNSVSAAGAIFVFGLSGDTWVLESKLVPSGTNSRIANDNFGLIFSAFGDQLAVHSKNGYTSDGATLTSNAGTVFVFKNTGSWAQTARLVGSRTANALFGSAVSIRDNILSIEASGNAASYIYENISGTWTLKRSSLDPVDSDYIIQTSLMLRSNTTSDLNGKNITLSLLAGSNVNFYSDNTVGRGFTSGALNLSKIANGAVYMATTEQFLTRAQFTWEHWFYIIEPMDLNRTNTHKTPMTLVSRAGGWSLNIIRDPAEANGGNGYFEVPNAGNPVRWDFGKFPKGKWFHVAVVRDGSELRTYLDGTLSNVYDITGVILTEAATSDICWGYNFYGANVPGFTALLAPQFLARDFYVRKTAAYDRNFSPSLGSFGLGASVLPNDNAFGRGRATHILDTNTILSGLPTGFTNEPVKLVTGENPAKVYHVETSLVNSGLVEVIEKASDTWSKQSSPIIPAGDIVFRSGFTDFGRTILVNKDILMVGSYSKAISTNGVYDSRFLGTVSLFDVKNDFEYITQYSPTLGNITGVTHNFGYTGVVKDTKQNLVDSNYRFSHNLLMDFDITPSSTNVTASAKKIFARYVSGRMTEFTLKSEFNWNFVPDYFVDKTVIDAAWTSNSSFTLPTLTGSAESVLYPMLYANDQLYYVNATGLRVHPNYDGTTSGFISPYTPDPTSGDYILGTQIAYPGSSVGARRADDEFGHSVKVAGTSIFVSERRSHKTANSNGGTVNLGAVFRYEYSDKNQGWERVEHILPSNTTTVGQYFGLSFDVFGDYLAVKSSGALPATSFYKNGVNGYEFIHREVESTVWDTYSNQTVRFMGSATEVITGSSGFGVAPRTNVGRATQYVWNGVDKFVAQAENFHHDIPSDFRFDSDLFGTSLALHGETVLIGIPNNDYKNDESTTVANIGGFIAYKKGETGFWDYMGRFTNPTGVVSNRFGSSLSVFGDNIALFSLNASTTISSFELYRYENGTYNFVETVTNAGNNTKAGAFVDATTILAGELAVGPTTAIRRIVTGGFSTFTKSVNTWTKSASQFVPTHTNGDYEQDTINYSSFANNSLARNASDLFGYSVKLSADKSTLVVGAPGHDYGVDPSALMSSNTGAIFAYYWDTGTSSWRLNTKVMDSVTTSSNNFGSNINLGAGTSFVVSSANISGSFSGSITEISPIGSGLSKTWSVTEAVRNSTNNETFGSDVSYDATRDLYLVGSSTANLTMGTGTINSVGHFETISFDGGTTRTPYSIETYIRNRNTSDYFGSSISLFETTLAVGVPLYDYDKTGANLFADKGAIFTYELSEEGYFEPKEKLTFETLPTNQNGTYVSLSADTLYVQSNSVLPTLYTRNLDGSFTQTSAVANNPNINLTVSFDHQSKVSWDATNKRAVVVGTTGTFNNLNVTNSFGGAITIAENSELSGFEVKSQNALPPTISSTGILEAPHLLYNGTTGFAQTGMAMSPDKSMIAIGAHAVNRRDSNSTTDSIVSGSPSYGKIYIYKWNDSKKNFEYHSIIRNPIFGQTPGSKIGLSWAGTTLSVTLPTPGIVLDYEYVDNQHWKVTSQHSLENSTQSAVLALNGNAIVLSKPTSSGYPIITNSGAARTQIRDNGKWISSRGIHAGADAESYNGTQGGAGGGAGAIGGKATGLGKDSFVSRRGAYGGTNLIPADGTEVLSNGRLRAFDTNPYSTGAGGNAPGSDGENGRVIISYDETEVVFDYTGADQTFVVPAGVTQIELLAWGAGGGAAWYSGAWTNSASGRGGAGAHVSGSISVTEGETLTIVVGAGGAGADGTLSNLNANRRYGLGGIGGVSSDVNSFSGGCGGGLAGVKRGETFVAIAGGGGGGAYYSGMSVSMDGMPAGYDIPDSSVLDMFDVYGSDLLLAPGIVNSRKASDYLGYDVKLIGDNLVLIGAPGHEYTMDGDILPSNAGAVFEYQRINSEWNLNQKISSSIPEANSYFGRKIEHLDDRIAILGSSGNYLASSPGTQSIGDLSTVIEVFDRVGSTMTSVSKTKLTVEDDRPAQVAFADVNHIVFGQPRKSTDGIAPSVTYAGGFSTYEITPPTLTLENVISGSGVSHTRFAGDLFGSSVEITNTQVIVGAPGHDYTENGVSQRNDQGALFVFDRSGTNFVYRSKLNLALDSTDLGLGTTLRLVGDKLYAGLSDASKHVELTVDSGNWSISRSIEASANTVAAIISSTQLMELDAASAVGIGSQPNLTGAGLAKTYTIDVDGSLIDANQPYSIPGKSNGRNANDSFGYSVYASNDFVVVGAPNHGYDEFGNTSTKTGSLFVFNKSGDNWVREAKLVADEFAPIGFGHAISGQNGWIITSGLTDTTGFARIFERVAEGDWAVRKDYSGSGTSGDSFANAVAIADSTKFIIGSSTSDGSDIENLIEDSGVVNAYERSGTTWTDLGAISSQGVTRSRNANDWFGYHIASNHNYVVVGSPQYSFDETGQNEIANSGTLWVYLRNEPITLIGKFVSPTRTLNGRFGTAVGIDYESNRIAVAEPGANKVHVFAFDGATMTLEQTLSVTLDTNEVFGATLAFNSGFIVVGSSKAQTDVNGENALVDAGAVYVWERNVSTGVWSLKEKLAGFTGTNGRNAGDAFGTSVALDNNGSLIVGSPDHDWDLAGGAEVPNAGAVVFKQIK